MRAQHAGDFLHRFQATAQGAEAPIVQKGLGPDYGAVSPEVGEGLLQLPGSRCGQLAEKQGMELLPGAPTHPTATPQERPTHMLQSLRRILSPRPETGTLPASHLVYRLIQMGGDVKAVQHMEGLAGLRGHHLQIRFPHIATYKAQSLLW